MARIQFLCKQYGKIFNKPYHAILLSVGFAVVAAAAWYYFLLPRDDTLSHTHAHPCGVKPLFAWNTAVAPISHFMADKFLRRLCACVSGVCCISFYHSLYLCVCECASIWTQHFIFSENFLISINLSRHTQMNTDCIDSFAVLSYYTWKGSMHTV